jgi:phage replication O-like protein O
MTKGNPQKENGFTPIANELMDVFCQTNLTSREWQVLIFVLRKLYGWRKIADVIALSQFEEATGLDRRTITRTLSSLIVKKILDKTKARTGNSYYFNKRYATWKVARDGATPTTRGVERPKLGTAPSHTKETIKRKLKKGDFIKSF